MRKYLYALAYLPLLTACGGGGGVSFIPSAHAEEPPDIHLTTSPDPAGWVPFIATVIDAVRKEVIVWKSPASGYLKAAVAGFSQVDFDGKGGTAVGGYFAAEGKGKPGVQNEIVAVYGRAEKGGEGWATALHGECYARTGDRGECIGVNIEPKYDAGEGRHIGVNVNPTDGARNVIGMQFQNPETYKWAIDLQGAPIRVGEHNGVSLCLQLRNGILSTQPCT